jgi:hypothetical protein
LRLILAALAGWALVQGAGPASAAKNVAACDIVSFAAQAAPIEIAAERWQSYRDKVKAILSEAHTSDTTQASQDVSDALVEAQTALLEPVKASEAYAAYLASDDCLVLTSLDPAGVEAVLSELAQSTPEQAIAAARQIANTARQTVSTIARSARFRSTRDQALLSAQYYCFAAGAIHALLSPEQQVRTGLDAFGHIVTCRDAGRK